MDTHLSDDELKGYRKRTAPPKELIATSSHLAVCDHCYKRFNLEDRTAATYAFVRDYLGLEQESRPDHLLYEQMIGFADETLDEAEAEAVKSHIKECQECDSDLRELLRIGAALNQAPTADAAGSELAIAQGLSARGADAGKPASAKGSRVVTKPATKPWDVQGGARGLGRLAPFWQTPVYRVAIQAASLVLMLGLVIWVMTRGLGSQVSRLEQEAAGLRQSNDDLRRQVGNAENLQSRLAELQQDNERLRQLGGSSGSAEVSLKDGGGVIALGGTGEVVGLEAVGSKYRELVKTALTSGRVSVAVIPASSEGRVGTTLGGEEQERFNVLVPSRSVVESERLVLRWEPLAGASGYVVFLKDAVSGEETESKQIMRTEWTPEKPLSRGHIYNWMVEAVKEGRRVRAPALDKPYASFKVLDNAQAQELKEAKQKWSGSHLLLGVLYARAGVRDQAVKEFKALLAENPGSPLAKKLLSGVKRV
jgi:hypothetical protein